MLRHWFYQVTPEWALFKRLILGLLESYDLQLVHAL
jgi:hypothetical protein